MFNAYLIYFSLLVFLLISTWLYNKVSASSRKVVLGFAIVIYSIVLGLRYNVGEDYMSYMNIYNMQDFDNVEWGYAILNRLLYNLGLPFSSIFILVAFLQIFFFVKGVEKINKKYLPLSLFFYFTTLYLFFSINGLRQAIAFSIFVFAIGYIGKKQLFKYLITIFLASTLHKSSLVLLPLYFIVNNDWLLRHRFLQIGVYFVTFTLSVVFRDFIINNANILFAIIGYGDYANSIDNLAEISWAKEGGIGIYFFMIIDLWIIWQFVKCDNLLSNKVIICFYNLYYLGVVIANITVGTYFDRMNVYFQHIRIVIYAIFFYNILFYRKNLLNRMFAVTIMVVFIIFFFMGISNKAGMCAPYQFIP